jgi:hypothetical protein
LDQRHRDREADRAPGVESAAIFGITLRAVGLDRTALRAAIGRMAPDTYVDWREVPARLDDVFIHLLGDKDRQC